jgi:N-acetylmuramoyl-L-alanine amidase
MKTGQDLLDLAVTRIGEDYVYGAEVDLDDPDWHGPWDCAEFCTWVVKQITGHLYGCLLDPPHRPDPWTGAWYRDVRNGTVVGVSIEKAARTPGALLLRYRAGGHHIVFVASNRSTVEAKSASWGVCRGAVGSHANWDKGILIPGVSYGD